MLTAMIASAALSAAVQASGGAVLRIPGVGEARFEVYEVSADSRPATNVLYAADFTPGGNWRPSGKGGGKSASCVAMEEDGRAFVRIGGKGRNGFANGVCIGPVATAPGVNCEMSFDGRSCDEAGSFVVYLRLYDSQGRDVTAGHSSIRAWSYSETSRAFYMQPAKPEATGKWCRRKCAITPPYGVAAIEARICPWRGEHLDCADVRIESKGGTVAKKIVFDAVDVGETRARAASSVSSAELSARIETDAGGFSFVTAEVRDTSSPPKPRALNVVMDVSADISGWTWHKDWRSDSKIDDSSFFYFNDNLGGHTVAVYPFSAVSKDGRGFAIGTPLDEPVFEDRFVTATGIRSTIPLGLLPRAGGRGSSAVFRWVAFPFSGTWGFRSAAKAYYEKMERLLPPSHAGEKEGTWLWPIFPSKVPENPDDFGLTFWEAPSDVGRRTNEIVSAHALGIGVFPYTEVWGMRQRIAVRPDGSLTPPEECLAELKGWSAAEAPRGVEWFCAPRRVAAQAALNSLPISPDGTHPFAVDKYDNWSQWWRTNPDPRLAKPNRASLCWDYTLASCEDAVDGVYLDSVSYRFAVNYRNVRKEHLDVMDEPLVYDFDTAVPCADGIQHQVAFVKWLAARLHSKGKRLFGNVFGITHRFNATSVDIFGCEVGSFGHRREKGVRLYRAESDSVACMKRFYAYHRPVANLLQEGNYTKPIEEFSAGAMRQYVEGDMFYGFYPGVTTIGGEKKAGYSNWLRYFGKDRQCERDRELFKAAIPVIRSLNRAGWRPETKMRSDSPDVWIERFGEMPGECYFTVRSNSQSPATATLSPEFACSLSPVWNGADLSSVPGGKWRITLAPFQTAVLRTR